jgi:Flp pilus assembly protein TadG
MRSRRGRAQRRRGAVLVLFVVALIPLVACVALAIDLGMVTFAQTQLCDAADAAALAGTRALNGNTANNNNYSAVTPTVQQVLAANSVLGTKLTASSGTVNIGRYCYNSTAQQFQGQFPGPSGQNWDMVQVTVAANVYKNLGFAKIMNLSMPNLQAVATAAHRARDVCLILDYSGSMRFSSLLGLPYQGDRVSNNPDTIYPTFGHYSVMGGSIQAAAPASPYASANITTTTSDGRPPIIQDFYTNATGTPAFSLASTAYCSTPAGDTPVKTNLGTGTSYAQTVAQILNINNPGNSTYDSTWETKGYKGYNLTTGTSGKFNGYTVGPGYWGKTFYIWPPDPTNDWRTVYFNFPTSKADNSLMWDSNGNWLVPNSSNGYTIDYTAVLNFINNIGPQVFPAQLQSGRICYYTSIPTSINTSTWPPTDLNQRFWKDYIDYVFGIMQTAAGNNYYNISSSSNGLTGYGNDLLWGTAQITALNKLTGGSKTPYMNYGDNPKRPLLSFWFGPMTMIDFLGNYNLWYTGYGNDCSRYCWWPGTCHEAPLYACKLGIQAALNDAQNNHPNDYYSVIMFSTPKSSASDTSASRFNRVRVALGQNYTNLTESLWYPPALLGQPTATVTPYDTNNLEIPRAMGGTCYAMGLMLAYNQFSCNSSLQTYNTGEPSGDAGGNGRQGAQKIIIFETDGAPNTTASANFNNNGAYQSYYSVRYNSNSPSTSEYPNNVNGYNDNDPTVTSQIYSLCTQLAASTTANGYSTSARPLLINCLAFGPQGSTGLPTLQQMQTIGNVNDNMPSYKVINGNAATIVSDLQTAIAKILQDGVQVSLIQ